ncbi:hypothetical protein IQ25_00679 [Novosphingobium taihuense]|nr:hypothetical protein IQ25_00679 [Novosphingobium taihuense]
MCGGSGAIGAAGARGFNAGRKVQTHRANPVVTQGQTGHPRADSTAPNPERRCGCGTRHDLRDEVCANDRFFSRSRLPEAKAVREPLPRLRPFTYVRPQAEPTRGSEPPPGHSQPVPRPFPRVPRRHRTGRAICDFPPGVTVRIRQRMSLCLLQKGRGRRSSPLPDHSTMKLKAPSPSSIRTVEPSGTSPPSSFSANGSCRYRCTARFKGLAP